MKRLIYFLLIGSFIYACSDVLDHAPEDEVTEGDYWTDVTHLQLYLNQFYPEFGSRVSYHNMDNNSDNLKPLAPHDILNGTRSVPDDGGGWEWTNIREINYFLENANEVTEGAPSHIDHYRGEGFFFRGYFYFQLLKGFGDLPWYEEPLNIDSSELTKPRDPRDQIAENIINDIDSAIDLLLEESQLPEENRISREVALLFKSRVALYEGTWEKYHSGTSFGVEGANGEEYLEMAATAAEEIIDSGKYSIYSTGSPQEDYFNLFNRTDLSGNEEVLLYEHHNPDLDIGTSIQFWLNGRAGSQTGVTKQLVDQYLCSNGMPISICGVYEGDTTIVQAVTNRDPRLEQTIWVPGEVQFDFGADQELFETPTINRGSQELSTTGYMVRKGSTPDPEQSAGTTTDNLSETDGIVFRYAEVLLNFAEAKAELGTITQADLDKSVNLLRERVGMPGLNVNVGYTDPNWNFPQLRPIINEIRRERRIELALEGFRYDDLMRWAAADLIQGKRWKGARIIMGKSFPDIEDEISDIPLDSENYIDRYRNEIPNGFGFDETRDYLFPIPTNQLNLNPNLEQNPGW